MKVLSRSIAAGVVNLHYKKMFGSGLYFQDKEKNIRVNLSKLLDLVTVVFH